MKKILAVLLCLLLLFAFVACDSNDEYTEDTPQSSTESASPAFHVNISGVKIELGADADPVIKALGTPKSTREGVNCGNQGTVKEYIYGSFEVYVLVSDKSSTIDGIKLLDDTVSTPEGIKIGSTESDVKSKYKSPTKASSSSYTYISGHKNLKFNFRDGAVIEINYLTA